MTIVNRARLSGIVGRTEKTISTWQADPDDPLPCISSGQRGKANQYETVDVVNWMIRRELARSGVDATGERLDLNVERARLLRAQAEEKERQNAVRSGELAPLKLLAVVLSRVAGEAASILDAVPLRLRHRLPHLKATEIEQVQSELAKARNTIAEIEISNDDLAECVAETGLELDPTAATVDAEPVG